MSTRPMRPLFKGERLTFGVENVKLWKKCEKEWRMMFLMADIWIN